MGTQKGFQKRQPEGDDGGKARASAQFLVGAAADGLWRQFQLTYMQMEREAVTDLSDGRDMVQAVGTCPDSPLYVSV